ncbi:hypothetical protein [Streptomyces sp. NPDC047061]|uniref:hypothetical protein n=1 Tax=Streptomyces sp. NPDC047061 TaxID=3154605 RepID=UPI0033E5F561
MAIISIRPLFGPNFSRTRHRNPSAKKNREGSGETSVTSFVDVQLFRQSSESEHLRQ